MPRTPISPINKDIRDKLGRIDRLSKEQAEYVRRRLRAIVDQHLDDLDYIFSEASFNLHRRRSYYYVFEAVMPQDPKQIYKMIERLEGWKNNIDQSIKALRAMHGAALR